MTETPDPSNPLAQTAVQVDAAQRGDDAALASLLARYLPQVEAIAAARIGQRLQSVLEVEDLVQEAMRVAIVGLPRFEHRTEGSFRNWLATCVENTIRKEARKLDAQKRGPGRQQRVADLAETRLAESLFQDDGPRVSEVARRKEYHALVEAALLQLSPLYREVVALRVHGELSYREIADAMDLPSENTANALYLRARQKLRRLVEQAESG